MKVILLDTVNELGKKGDVVDVSEGYARNFLLPRHKATKATAGALAKAERLRATRIEAELKAKDAASRKAAQLAGTRVVLAAQAGDEGKLYGSVGTADIVEGIRKFTGLEVERKTIDIRKPIKAIGLHEVYVKLHPEVEFPITIDIIPT